MNPDVFARPSTWFRAVQRVPWVLRACFAVVLTAALGVQCMCANTEYSRAYHAHVAQELEAYRHAGSLDEVASDVASVLSDQGYVAHPSVMFPSPVETEWKATRKDRRSRYTIELSATPEGVVVRATLSTEALSPKLWAADTRVAAVELERALLVSVRPEIAEGIADADLRAHEYSTAAPVLWDALQRVAAEHGAPFKRHEPPTDAVATSMWNGAQDEQTRWRYEVRFGQEGNRTRVRIDRAVEKAVGERRWISRGEAPDLSFERSLLERRDPERAAVIEATARAQGQEAYDEALARGAPAWTGCGCNGCAP